MGDRNVLKNIDYIIDMDLENWIMKYFCQLFAVQNVYFSAIDVQIFGPDYIEELNSGLQNNS